ncbi:hypothetical protein [Lentzea sp. NPDC059081]|uniref:hypothetical protein n=1 Tax=Lentzea sp. NPDC059081 TaxID=3346719 RepID=UPI00368C3A4E
MLTMMLCGASDIDEVQREFDAVVGEFGGESLHFTSGRMVYDNKTSSSWPDNSRATVRRADVCVFAVVEQVGEITWQTEFREALSLGKALLIFCRQKTYREYLTLRKNVEDLDTLREDKRKLVEVLSELESGRAQTIVPYEPGLFGVELRRHLALLFSELVRGREERAARSAVHGLLSEPERLTTADLAVVAQIAADELENKIVRKRAVAALALRQAADDELVRALVSSSEQGVQRLAVEHIAALYRTRPAELEMFEMLVSVANASDDVGIGRRLIPALLGIDFVVAVTALSALDMSDAGVRRRLAHELESREQLVDGPHLRRDVVALLKKCLEDGQESGWRKQCRSFVARLDTPAGDGDPPSA